MTTRSLLESPDPGVAIHVIGDTHVGAVGSAAAQWRCDAISGDFRRGAISRPLFHMQVGDNTENGVATEIVNYKNLIARLPSTVYSGIGNHDLFGQTAPQWAASLGYASQNYIVDYPTFRLIVIGGDSGTPQQLSLTTLAFLDAALGGTALPCVVSCHYPLYNTVGGDSSVEYVSTAAVMFVCSAARTTDSNDVLAVLGAHSNLKLWLSGHTHSRLTVPGLVMGVNTGAATFASVNASSPYYQGLDHTATNGGASDIVATLMVNWFPSAGRVDVRFRDHIAGQWLAPNGNPVLTVTL